MDPVAQADGAADLNLKLMKWRAAPSLDLARLASTKCLLLGAGAARCVRWGVAGVMLNTGDRILLCAASLIPTE
jgi:ubiquitin-like modifier-activating enzyme ATG7